MRSFLSREASFLLNNLLFVAICFAIFWGTVFPIVSEWVTGQKITVSAPFFNKVNLPLGFALLVLTGICPLIAWRKATGKNFRRNFLYPLVGALLSGIAAVALGVLYWLPLLFFSAAGFVALTVFFEFYKGSRARQAIKPSSFWMALKDLTLMNKRRYGGFIIHTGVILVFIVIIASSVFGTEKYFTVKRGDRFSFANYTMVLQKMAQKRDPEKEVVFARVEVFRDGKAIDILQPEKHFHHKNEQPMTEVAIRKRFEEDLYVVLSGWDDKGNVTFHIFVNPLVQLIWWGILVMVLGGVFVLFPNKKPGPAVALRKAVEEVKDEAA